MVDPNMVLKKTDDKEIEVQEGWVGRILPFELVQTKHLLEEWTALRQKEERLERAVAEVEFTFDELGEEERSEVSNDDGTLALKAVASRLSFLLSAIETEEIYTLSDYLCCSRKKEKLDFVAAHPEIAWGQMTTAKDGTFSAKTVNARIAHLRESYPFGEGSTEAKLIRISALSEEVKQLKSEIKADAEALHLHTKQVIENKLTDEDVRVLLSEKWIETLSEHLLRLPYTVIDNFVTALSDLGEKYDTTLQEVEEEMNRASIALATMIDDLTGSAHDLEALAEFKKLLLND